MTHDPTATAPPAPVSRLEAAAIAAHESFTALQGAGFTESQALRLVALTMAEVGRG